MSKKSKILCVILVIIFIAAIISTAIRGLNVSMEYAEGTSIVFDLGKQYDKKDIKQIAKEIWPNESIFVQKVEVYDESVLIKVSQVNDEQLDNLATKINEKYGLELKKENFTILYNSNNKIRDIVKPYIIPLIIATALIVVYYSIKFKGVKEILEFLLSLVAVEGIIYSVYALAMLPINIITMPIVMITYGLVTIFVTLKNETK